MAFAKGNDGVIKLFEVPVRAKRHAAMGPVRESGRMACALLVRGKGLLQARPLVSQGVAEMKVGVGVARDSRRGRLGMRRSLR